MKSFIKEIEKKFEQYESQLTDEVYNPDAEQDDEDVPMPHDDEGRPLDSKSKPRRWQDGDGDGIWYEPGVDVKEVSTSAGAGSYMTPKAFGKADDDTIEALGYRKVQEAMDKKYAQLIEGYRSYVTENPKLTPEKKVKNTIREVSKKMSEIEEMVKHASRLKTESGMSKDGYGPQVERALNKISERLIKISERVRSLGE